MAKKKSLLVSADFRVSFGGISRVAHFINKALECDKVISLYGSPDISSTKTTFYGGNRFQFVFTTVSRIIFSRFDFVVFDHLGVASLLVFIPQVFLNKIVIFLHDEEAWSKVSGRQKAALHKAHVLLTNSNHTYNRFVERNPAFRDKTKVCLLGGVPKSFEDLLHINESHYSGLFTANQPYLLFVARLWVKHRYKGGWELLDAYKQLKGTKAFNLKLVIIGRGDDSENMLQYIEENDLGSSVTLYSNLSDSELALFYQNSSGLIFPSTREGFGLVILEAMFFKKAAVGIVNQPAEEIILDNETGLLLEDNSPKTLVNVLLYLNSNPEKLIVWGEKAFEHYNLNFTKEKFMQRFLQSIS